MNAIKNSLKQFKANKYHSNLLGESLEDLCRRATAKTLDQPDDSVNSQVVQAINDENTQSPREVANLLKKRLQQDNPQKQFLAVVLVGKVLRECSAVVSLHQEELLQEVARVIARPGKRDNVASQQAKQAAKDLLRSYGRTGYDAIRFAARENLEAVRTGNGFSAAGYGGPQPYGAPVGYPAHSLSGAYPPQAYPGMQPPAGAIPPFPYQGGQGEAGGTAATERASILDEVKRMIEHAKAHTELLQEMLVNSDGVRDESERELQVELLVEVRELREMFTPYLEQLSSLEGNDVEALVCEALQAVDVLDNALALEKEVSSTAQETAFKSVQPAPLKPPAGARDLIDFSDLDSALPPAPPGPSRDPFGAPAAAGSQDPFAALTAPPPSNPAPQDPWANLGAPVPASASQPPPQEYFGGGMQSQMGAPSYQTVGGMHSSPPTAQLGPQPVGMPRPQQQPGYPQQQPGYPQQQPGYPQQQPGYPQQQQVGSPPSMGLMGSPPAYGSPPPAYQGAPPAFQQPRPAYGMGAPYGAQQPPSYGSLGASQQSFGQASNPFSPAAAAAGPFPPAGPQAPQPASNPFTAPAAAPAQKSSVDQEWEMFFADRAGGTQPAGRM